MTQLIEKSFLIDPLTTNNAIYRDSLPLTSQLVSLKKPAKNLPSLNFDELQIWQPIFTGEATGGFLCEKMFLEISQNSQENSCARVSFLIKLLAPGLQLYQKRTSGTGVFSWIFLTFFTEHFWTTASVCFSEGWA